MGEINTEMNIGINKKIYEFAYTFLLNSIPKQLKEEDLKLYLNNEINRDFDSINDLTRSMISILQNYQSLPNIIGFEEKQYEISDILFEFNPNKIISYDTDNLYEIFYGLYKFKNKESKRNSWLKWTKGIISCAHFFSNFDSAKDFHNFCNNFSYNKYTIASLPMILQKEIYGLGFALACDFLKENGYANYPKPDVHLIEIFYQLKLSNSKDPYEVFKGIVDFSLSIDKTPFEVDKLFWLISSGRFHKHNIKIKGKRTEFILKAKEYLQNI